MKKLWIRGLAVLLFGAGVVLLCVDLIVGSLIEEGASYALGVETRVGFARLRILDGVLRLHRVRLANPPGFDEPHFLAVRSAEIAADLGSARGDVVEVPLILLQGVDVALERDGSKTNYGVILQHMGRFEKGDPEPEDAGRRFVVRRLRIEDVSAHVEWSQLAPNQTGLALSIPVIELRNLGEQGGGLSTAELSNLVVKAILGSIAREGGGLPAAVVSGLDAGLRGVTRLSDGVIEGAEKILRDAAGDGLEAVGRAAGRVLGGLLGGGEEERPGGETR